MFDGSSALGQEVSTALDGDGDGTPDGCNDYASAISGDCQIGEIIKWDGTVWACAADETHEGIEGPQGAPGKDGKDGSDGLSSLVEISPEAPGCAAGGITVYAGLDVDGNGALGSAEATATTEVCPGEMGVQGNQG